MSYNKCHTNLEWTNDTTPAINETNLNYMDGCIDTVDDRVVALDTAKLEASDIASVIKSVTCDDTTGIFTFTCYDDSTFTIDTKLEKIVTNWTYDSDTQSLVLTLEDGSTVNVSLSEFITETEFVDSSTIGFTVTDHVVTATVLGNSIGDDQMETAYLTNCQSAAETASTAATTSNTNRLEAEGYAVGTQDGVEVTSGTYYQNNAKYYCEQAEAIASQSLGGLTDVTITSPTDGQALTYDSNSGEWVNSTPASALTDLTDVTISSATEGDTLQYDSSTSKWVNVPVYNNAGFHNSVYRGKYLGSALTDDQSAAITAGTFDDLFIGDYWTIDSVNYRIAAFDYYYNTGDTACTTHHAVIVPETSLYTAKMNSSVTTDGAYIGSVMYITNLATAKSTIETAFGSDHILSHRQYLKNAVTDGYESGGAWYDSTVELMTEQNVYGGKIFANCIHGTNYAIQTTVDKSQYPLFAFDPTMITIREHYWLRDVANASYFCFVYSSGLASALAANNAFGVRPAFSIY